MLTAIIVSLSLVSSARTIDDLGRTKAPVSKYADFQPKNSPGQRWVSSYLKSPDGSKGWSKSSNQTSVLDPTGCTSNEVVSEVLFSGSSWRNGSVVNVYVLTPGRSKTVYQDLRKKLAECGRLTGSSNNSFTTDDGSFTFIGDVLFRTKKVDDRVLENARSTLAQSGCKDLTPTIDDFRRNLFFSEKDYSGRIVDAKVRTRVSVASVPQPVYPNLKDEPWMEEPEGPLPKTLDELPEAQARPAPPINPDSTRPSLERGYSYQWTDPIGPGCGWSWFGFKQPVVNLQLLEKTRDDERRKTQSALDGDVRQYIDDKIAFSKDSFTVMQSFADWNAYVERVEEVHRQWRKLLDDRRKVEPAWRAYVEAYDYWVNFYRVRANAQKKYDEELKLCQDQDQALEDWQNEWGEEYRRQQNKVETPVETPSPSDSSSNEPTQSNTGSGTTSPTDEPSSPTDEPSSTSTTEPVSEPKVDIPEPPEGCQAFPKKPSIVEQNRPVRPQSPELPEDVTIPESWPRPISTPTVEIQ